MLLGCPVVPLKGFGGSHVLGYILEPLVFQPSCRVMCNNGPAVGELHLCHVLIQSSIVFIWAWMQCMISRVSPTSWSARKEETSRSGSDDLTVVDSLNPPATTITGLSIELCSIRWGESSIARSALFSTSDVKLDQSDWRGTVDSFSILRRTGRWRCFFYSSAWFDRFVSIPVKDHVDSLVLCSHLEHSFCEDVCKVTKRLYTRRLSKCHHKCLAINERTAGFIDCDICWCFNLLCQYVC